MYEFKFIIIRLRKFYSFRLLCKRNKY